LTLLDDQVAAHEERAETAPSIDAGRVVCTVHALDAGTVWALLDSLDGAYRRYGPFEAFHCGGNRQVVVCNEVTRCVERKRMKAYARGWLDSVARRNPGRRR
jgi:hypothetical protein